MHKLTQERIRIGAESHRKKFNTKGRRIGSGQKLALKMLLENFGTEKVQTPHHNN